MPVFDYLAPGTPRAEVLHTLAIVSDTHMPQRCRTFPPGLFDVLAGADLVLHAGDVGELWVLDRLSAIAPVIAVHGNDDTPAAKAALPYSTLLSLPGARVFLWHSHFPAWQDEHASRQGEEMLPKLQRTVETARSTGASLAVFGHWHIPLLHDAGDLLVVNPGALASGNMITRQIRCTVAIAWLLRNGAWQVAHVDLAQPEQPYAAGFNWDEGFSAVLGRYSATILEPALAADMPWLMAHTPPALLGKLRDIVLGLAHSVWEGDRPLLTYAHLAEEARRADSLSEDERAQLETILRARTV